MDNVTRQTFNEVMVPNYQPADLIPVRGAGSTSGSTGMGSGSSTGSTGSSSK